MVGAPAANRDCIRTSRARSGPCPRLISQAPLPGQSDGISGAVFPVSFSPKPERGGRSADALLREEEFQREPGAGAAPGTANRTVRYGHRLGRGGAPGWTRGRGRQYLRPTASFRLRPCPATHMDASRRQPGEPPQPHIAPLTNPGRWRSFGGSTRQTATRECPFVACAGWLPMERRAALGPGETARISGRAMPGASLVCGFWQPPERHGLSVSCRSCLRGGRRQ